MLTDRLRRRSVNSSRKAWPMASSYVKSSHVVVILLMFDCIGVQVGATTSLVSSANLFGTNNSTARVIADNAPIENATAVCNCCLLFAVCECKIVVPRKLCFHAMLFVRTCARVAPLVAFCRRSRDSKCPRFVSIANRGFIFVTNR